MVKVSEQKQFELGDKIFWFDLAKPAPEVELGVICTKDLDEQGYLKYSIMSPRGKFNGLLMNIDYAEDGIEKKLKAFMDLKAKQEELVNSVYPDPIFDMEKLTAHFPKKERKEN